MHDNIGCKGEQDEAEEIPSNVESSPVMAVFEDVKAVAVEVDIAIEVHLQEGSHGDLMLAPVLDLVRILLEGEVVLNGAARELDLLVEARAVVGGHPPEGNEERHEGEDEEEDCRLHAPADLPC